MAAISPRKRIWGWMMFDWASQPYNTLLLTFIFGPYFAEIAINRLVGEGMELDLAKATAQSWWGYGLAAGGVSIAILAPILGAIADSTGRRMPWVWVFSILYVVGAAGLWLSDPATFNVTVLLIFFGIGLIGMEFATIFTNAMLPGLGSPDVIGEISGNGWAWGYVGGVLALAIMLLFFAESEAGTTLIGIEPVLGLDPASREGTRFVGPFTAIWFFVFMIPFFLWVREPKAEVVRGVSVRQGLKDLVRTLKSLPKRVSMTAYLGSSMLYRDALNGMYTFGGLFALNALGWSAVDTGVFGIMAAVTGALFAFLGGRADRRFGPKPVIMVSIVVLIGVCLVILTMNETSVLGMTVSEGSSLPDITFYICGGLIGAAGGSLQTASRTMMIRQADPARITEAFGLYALSGKATSFLAPVSIAAVSQLTGSYRLGITPLIGLFTLGLILLVWVKPYGEGKS